MFFVSEFTAFDISSVTSPFNEGWILYRACNRDNDYRYLRTPPHVEDLLQMRTIKKSVFDERILLSILNNSSCVVNDLSPQINDTIEISYRIRFFESNSIFTGDLIYAFVFSGKKWRVSLNPVKDCRWNILGKQNEYGAILQNFKKLNETHNYPSEFIFEIIYSQTATFADSDKRLLFLSDCLGEVCVPNEYIDKVAAFITWLNFPQPKLTAFSNLVTQTEFWLMAFNAVYPGVLKRHLGSIANYEQRQITIALSKFLQSRYKYYISWKRHVKDRERRLDLLFPTGIHRNNL